MSEKKMTTVKATEVVFKSGEKEGENVISKHGNQKYAVEFNGNRETFYASPEAFKDGVLTLSEKRLKALEGQWVKERSIIQLPEPSASNEFNGKTFLSYDFKITVGEKTTTLRLSFPEGFIRNGTIEQKTIRNGVKYQLENSEYVQKILNSSEAESATIFCKEARAAKTEQELPESKSSLSYEAKRNGEYFDIVEKFPQAELEQGQEQAM